MTECQSGCRCEITKLTDLGKWKQLRCYSGEMMSNISQPQTMITVSVDVWNPAMKEPQSCKTFTHTVSISRPINDKSEGQLHFVQDTLTASNFVQKFKTPSRHLTLFKTPSRHLTWTNPSLGPDPAIRTVPAAPKGQALVPSEKRIERLIQHSRWKSSHAATPLFPCYPGRQIRSRDCSNEPCSQT